MSRTIQAVAANYVQYLSCRNCERHPKYPEILPMTLHRGNACIICGFAERGD